MARKRQVPPLNDTVKRKPVPVKRLLLAVAAEMDLSPLVNQCVAEIAPSLVNQYIAEILFRLCEPEEASQDSKEQRVIMKRAGALFQKILPQELEESLSSALSAVATDILPTNGEFRGSEALLVKGSWALSRRNGPSAYQPGDFVLGNGRQSRRDDHPGCQNE